MALGSFRASVSSSQEAFALPSDEVTLPRFWQWDKLIVGQGSQVAFSSPTLCSRWVSWTQGLSSEIPEDSLLSPLPEEPENGLSWLG